MTAPAPRSSTSVMWFRRDLRLGDNPALLDATAAADEVALLFVVDPRLWGPAGAARKAYLCASLAALDVSVGGRLVVRHGDPVLEVPRLAAEVGARSVHVAADFGPYGAERDRAVQAGLAAEGRVLQRTGSPYAVAPGRLTTGAGSGYQVFTPFARAWAEHGWRPPAQGPGPGARWAAARSEGVPAARVPDGMRLPRAGEAAARDRWHEFLAEVEEYDARRDRPDLDGTSRMSVHLKWGEIHPRTLLADLGAQHRDGGSTYRRELAWREFYADVLHRRPETARTYLRPEFATMEYDDPQEALGAWQEGRTGFPVVDAGMRQLLATGWMHNRVRMVVASFLVKDLHLDWRHGARHFLRHLVDADLASNQHNWQWVAGSGTDAAPYFRVFNPTAQGKRYDPSGDYVRRWVPELADVETAYIHEPWKRPGGPPEGYPAPLVDHAAERREALARLERMRP